MRRTRVFIFITNLITRHAVLLNLVSFLQLCHYSSRDTSVRNTNRSRLSNLSTSVSSNIFSWHSWLNCFLTQTQCQHRQIDISCTSDFMILLDLQLCSTCSSDILLVTSKYDRTLPCRMISYVIIVCIRDTFSSRSSEMTCICLSSLLNISNDLLLDQELIPLLRLTLTGIALSVSLQVLLVSWIMSSLREVSLTLLSLMSLLVTLSLSQSLSYSRERLFDISDPFWLCISADLRINFILSDLMTWNYFLLVIVVIVIVVVETKN